MGSQIYAPLDPQKRETRLLRLAPSTDLDAIPICEMYKADLGESPVPDYMALSYAWGDQNMKTEIIVNGFCRNVTVNLATALRYLRDASETLILWADAICINQEDVSERGFQVNNMTLIYQEARKVFAWVGELTDDAKFTIEWIKMYSTWATAGQMNESDPVLEMFFNLDEADFNKIMLFSSRAYWRRVWVFQELMLARQTEVVIGSIRLPMDIVVPYFKAIEKLYQGTVFRTLDNYEKPVPHNIGVKLYGTGLVGMLRLLSEHSPRYADSPKPVDLSMKCLDAFSVLEATDPRDKIFGLLGVLQQGSNDGPTITADYAMSFEELNFQVARAQIFIAGDLSSIVHTGNTCRENRLSTFPSWMTDLTRWRTGALPLKTFLHKNRRYPTCDVSYLRYIHVLVTEQVLVTTGSVLETIRKAHDHEHDNKLSVFGRNLESFASDVLTAEPWRGEPPLQTLFRLSNAGGIYNALDKFPVLSQFQLSSAAVFLAVVALGFSFIDDDDGYFVDAYLGDTADREMREELLDLYSTVLKAGPQPFTRQLLVSAEYYLHRSYFRTTTGYMGIGPEHMRQGDKICQLIGHELPIILRPVENYFELVGECFVLDLQLGDITPELAASMREFEIR